MAGKRPGPAPGKGTPGSGRRGVYDTFTPERQGVFLQELTEGRTIRDAAKKAGVSFLTAYNHRAVDPEFRASWDVALELGVQALEGEAIRRAKDGVLRDVYHQGKVVGQYRECSDEMLRFILRAKRPDIYRERSDLLDGVDLSLLTAEQKARVHALVKELRELLGGPRSPGSGLVPELGPPGSGASRRDRARALLLGPEPAPSPDVPGARSRTGGAKSH